MLLTASLMSRCSSASMWSLNPSHPPHDKMIAESQRYLHRSGSTVDVSSPRRRPVLGTLPSRPSDSHWSSRDAANKLARIRWFTEKGGGFGWHCMSFTQAAAALAAPGMAARRWVPLGRLGIQVITVRLIHELAIRDALNRGFEYFSKSGLRPRHCRRSDRTLPGNLDRHGLAPSPRHPRPA